MLVTKFITKKKGFPSAPNVKVVARVQVAGNQNTFKFKKKAKQAP